jgi:hypothetical protein
MSGTTETPVSSAERWLAEFEKAMAEAGDFVLTRLFHPVGDTWRKRYHALTLKNRLHSLAEGVTLLAPLP